MRDPRELYVDRHSLPSARSPRLESGSPADGPSATGGNAHTMGFPQHLTVSTIRIALVYIINYRGGRDTFGHAGAG